MNRTCFITNAAERPNVRATAASLALACGLAVAHAQPDLSPGGGTHTFTGAFEEFVIPDFKGSVITFTVLGADGGDAQVARDGACFNAGGQGATARMDAVIGTGSTELRPGEAIRFIVGQRGQDGIQLEPNTGEGAGGGGGSGVVYQIPNDNTATLQPLVVAGGGGGAYARVSLGICVRSDQEGGDAQTGECGAGSQNGNQSECDGLSGVAVQGASGGGGGILGTGGLVLSGRSASDRGGAGGIGGRNGGFGFGGGGAAAAGRDAGSGGGGGYSGGAGGSRQRAGGGGGSFTASSFSHSLDSVTTGSPGTRDGRISYAITGQVHDERTNALPLDPNSTTLFGSTTGATPSADSLCTPSALTRDVWYRYQNTTSGTLTLQVTRNSSVAFSEIVDANGLCLAFAPGVGTNASTDVAPGATVFLRVAAFSQTFSVPYSISATPPPDADGDGIPDDDDMCPGINDSIAPMVNTNGNGILDFCDGSIPFDTLTDLGIIGSSGPFVARADTIGQSNVSAAIPFVYDNQGTLLGVGRVSVPGSSAGTTFNQLSIQLEAGVYYLGVSAAAYQPKNFFQLGPGNAQFDPMTFGVTTTPGNPADTQGQAPLAANLARYFRFELTQGAVCSILDTADPISVLDSDDIKDFLNRFDAGVLDPNTDIDKSGTLDVFDLIKGLQLFDGGC